MRALITRAHDALGLRTGPVIFTGSAAVTLLFVVTTILFTDTVDGVFAGATGWLMENLGWFYVLGVTVFLIFLVYMAASRWGRVKLGADDEEPEHSGPAWFAMLFAAGIGTILMFWGVAEPINHYANPPMQDVDGGTVAAFEEAMAFTLYHFGLHTWTIFTLPALAFAYFMYKRNLPPRVSSIFYPLIGDRIHGPLGAVIDITAIVGTMFGVAVSVGLGTLQINSGLAALFGVEESRVTQILIILVVTAIATISVAVGLDRGIKRLSNLNIVVAVGLLFFVLVTGPTLFLLQGTIESVGTYLSWLPELAFWNDTVNDSDWQSSWTVFYWAWTISWSPFVGIFIARISRGRSIRQFVIGVLGIPVAFSLIWFGVFGWGSFSIERDDPGTLVEPVVEQGDVAAALFVFLESFPLTTVTSVVSILLVVVFFTTSVDSAALVMDTIANGHEDPAPTRQRVFWALCVAAVAGTLLGATGAGGLEALQQVIIVVGLPFFVMGYLMIYSILKALREDAGERPPLRTRRWRRVLPPEEAERRGGEGHPATTTQEHDEDHDHDGDGDHDTDGEDSRGPLLTKTDTSKRDQVPPRDR
ncbi:BCCT family transporter [Thalassiella azotivora]